MKTLITLLLTLLAGSAMAGQLTVAAASDLAYGMDDLAKGFRRLEPKAMVKISTGASGSLFAQVKNGAPFDVFMSADMEYPARLAREGAADGKSLMQYASGQLVYWTSAPGVLPARGLATLLDPRVRRIAIANPDVAPYGKAAREVLIAAGLWEELQPRLVLGENVAQAAQFAHSGNAQAALLSLSAVRSPHLRRVGRFSVLEGVAVRQGAIITSRGKNNPLAARWMAYLGTDTARAILARHGFAPPAPAR
ncbi:molybdate ABC transporter substrate-binding protein [Pseudoduganella sp. GCM10020061]|uniref:molybdate ABC transporter substrate-binding protein n=1 Tax=Pseudoduganella sp. GCM10020061 TaxID=3317345 RepID=UPI00362B87B7